MADVRAAGLTDTPDARRAGRIAARDAALRRLAAGPFAAAGKERARARAIRTALDRYARSPAWRLDDCAAHGNPYVKTAQRHLFWIVLRAAPMPELPEIVAALRAVHDEPCNSSP